MEAAGVCVGHTKKSPALTKLFSGLAQLRAPGILAEEHLLDWGLILRQKSQCELPSFGSLSTQFFSHAFKYLLS